MSSRARELIDATLVWDNHICLPLRPQDETFLPQLDRCREAGFNHVSLNIGFGDDTVEHHLRVLATFRTWLKRHPERYVLVERWSDIERARREGKLAVSFDIEGAKGIDDQPSLIELYYDLGVRWMLIAYNRNNLVGGGIHDNDLGLTPYGRRVLNEMARVGMVVCCSHTGERTVRDVFEHAQGPVIFSHSNSRAIHDHPRNITDAQMRLCARSGGVVGINGLGIFLGRNDSSTERFLAHLDHAVQTIGADHVGLGLDYVFDQDDLQAFLKANRAIFPASEGYDQTITMVEPERLEAIVEGLISKGYDQAAVAAILGGNFSRVAKTVWRH